MSSRIVTALRRLQKLVDFREYTILYALLFMWLVLFLSSARFGSFDNLRSILRESSFVGIAAIGMTLCIISGHFDLSVGSMVALLAIETVWLVGKIGLVPTFLAVLLSGFFLGVLNGSIVAKVRVPAFITTLGTFYIFRAVAYIVTGGAPLKFSETWFTVWGNGFIIGLPISFVIFLCLAIVGTYILRGTYLGRNILAIGNSEKASRIAGINIDRTKILVFGLVGVFTAASAILISSRLWSANPKMLNGYEFKVIAAVVLGGTALSGGKGSIFNTFVSAIFFVTISNAMLIYRVDSFVIQVVTGLILLFAFALNTLRGFVEQRIARMRAKKETG